MEKNEHKPSLVLNKVNKTLGKVKRIDNLSFHGELISINLPSIVIANNICWEHTH